MLTCVRSAVLSVNALKVVSRPALITAPKVSFLSITLKVKAVSKEIIMQGSGYFIAATALGDQVSP